LNTLIIDADTLVFQAACVVESSFDFGDGEVTRVTDEARAIAEFDQRVFTLKELAQAEEVLLALSCPTRRYFRHELCSTYKENRANKPAPLSIRAVRAHAEKEYPHKIKPGLEADDVIGILGTHKPFLKDRELTIWSMDKDLKQVPGRHLNVKENRVEKINNEEARRHHLYQTLVGDTCDNYPGCPGIGPVKANRILDEDCSWAAVVAAFESKGLTAEDALLQARLARILSARWWDFENNKPILWSPPSDK
jgi:DNA polymerase I